MKRRVYVTAALAATAVLAGSSAPGATPARSSAAESTVAGSTVSGSTVSGSTVSGLAATGSKAAPSTADLPTTDRSTVLPSTVLPSTAAPSSAAGSAESRDRLPLPYHGSAGQVVTVVGANASATTATVTAWQRTPTGGWHAVVGPVTGYVGAQGIGQASEATSHTPAGVFTLTESFGNLPTNGTRLPYRRIDTSDWWVSDVRSPLYNTYHRCAPGTCSFDERAGEDLGKAGPAYDHAVVIDYNRHPVVPGAGSAFFLHVSRNQPTAGCVAIPIGDLNSIMTWLDPGLHPAIDIGIG